MNDGSLACPHFFIGLLKRGANAYTALLRKELSKTGSIYSLRHSFATDLVEKRIITAIFLLCSLSFTSF